MGALVGGLFLLLLSFGAFLNFYEFKAPWLLASGILLMVLAIICIKKFFSMVSRKDKSFKNVVHLGGLEVPLNCEGAIWLKGRELIMEFNGDKAILNIDRIIDVEGTYDVRVETYEKKTGFVKGMAATAAFGLPGAVLSSIPKTKKRENLITDVTITYRNEMEIPQKLYFRDAEDSLIVNCARLFNTLNHLVKKEPKKNKTIEL